MRFSVCDVFEVLCLVCGVWWSICDVFDVCVLKNNVCDMFDVCVWCVA